MELNEIIDQLLSSPINNNNENITLSKTLKTKTNYPIILIGGTNGKGSVCAYLTTILTLAGFKVGTYTSPHVFNYNERICINNIPIDNNILSNALSRVIKEHSNIGLFRTFTIAAHHIF